MEKKSKQGKSAGGIDIGISFKDRELVIGVLAATLADEVLLYLKTRNFHWNVVAPNFSEMHKFFEAQYEALDEVFDDVAERIRSLGGRAPGSMAEFLKLARLEETAGVVEQGIDMVHVLLADHESMIRVLRKDVERVADTGDHGSEDFLTGLLQEHEKMAWMLRSYVP